MTVKHTVTLVKIDSMRKLVIKCNYVSLLRSLHKQLLGGQGQTQMSSNDYFLLWWLNLFLCRASGWGLENSMLFDQNLGLQELRDGGTERSGKVVNLSPKV